MRRLVRLPVAVFFTTLAAAACDDGEKTVIPDDVPDVEVNCTDGIDNDEDGATDCDDSPDCDRFCLPDTESTCDDGEDEDADGQVDCADPDCQDSAACSEICDNGIDDDRDSAIDCADADCAGHAHCLEDCTDLSDNDRDGLIDCEDPDCADACVEDCDNGVDDDQDGLTDCADGEDCEAVCDEVCDNDLDDDGDELVDCADDECEGDAACDEVCDNGEDDDLDGLTDCEDADCLGHPSCDEVCDNGEDDDVDGLTDCEDDDCWADPACETVSLEVTGGQMRVQALDNYALVFSTATYRVSQTDSVTATVIGGEGLIRLTRPDGSTVCDWSFGRAVFTGTYIGAVSLTLRQGFQTSGGCGGLGSSVLPTRLDRAGHLLKLPSASRLTWYGGTPSFSTSTAYSTSIIGPYFSFTFIQRRSGSWLVPSVTGGPYLP